MIQLGGFLFLSYNPPFKKTLSSARLLANSYAIELKTTGDKKFNKNDFVDRRLSLLGRKIKKGDSSIAGSGRTLTNNEIKDIIKAIESLENRGILLKETTSQEAGFFNFLRRFMAADLPLMKTVLTPLAKSVNQQCL